MSSFLSVDFDFFVFNGLEADNLFEPLLFDWGHSESHPAVLQQILWQHRHHNFRANGICPEEICDASSRGHVSVNDFVHAVRSKVVFNDSVPEFFDLTIADSHALGFRAAAESYATHGPLDVIHFDAHADLGYNSDHVAKEEECGTISCESWLHHAMTRGLVQSVVVVYPDWRAGGEFPPDKIPRHIDTEKITFTNWSKWLTSDTANKSIDSAFVCRSSAWSPPWMDRQFSRLVELISPNIQAFCYDCSPENREIHDNRTVSGSHDACKDRTFSPLPEEFSA